MGEIPSWLIDLAESSNNDDEEAQEEEQTPVVESLLAPETQPESGFLEEPITLMDELRSQVEVDPSDEPETYELIPLSAARSQVVFAGMVPWQLALLSILLFLDIAVIGLLFLVMLGRISIL